MTLAAKKLTASEIRDGLRTQTVGRKIEIHKEVESTNDLARIRGVEGAPDGTLILADSQIAGRGRHGRRWHAPPGSSILASLILRHRLLANQIGLPSIAGATAIAAAIRKLTNLDAAIRWPNDVLIRGKKLSGVLTELEYDQERQPFLVMGFGVNVNTILTEFPQELQASATSLRVETGTAFSRVAVIQSILHRLEEYYLHLKNGEVATLIARANTLSATIGSEVQVQTAFKIIEGKDEGIDQDGGLLIRDEHGCVRKFLVGEVIHTEECRS
ncbi:MAG: biotin--[acetyl-CoA-carboxylase] ligase [Candidatus Poribacteria bacterium]|nr:biotin--[acetyl-CoA-carboxylase] ligase [Candidatus Poribacteria bacterium]